MKRLLGALLVLLFVLSGCTGGKSASDATGEQIESAVWNTDSVEGLVEFSYPADLGHNSSGSGWKVFFAGKHTYSSVDSSTVVAGYYFPDKTQDLAFVQYDFLTELMSTFGIENVKQESSERVTIDGHEAIKFPFEVYNQKFHEQSQGCLWVIQVNDSTVVSVLGLFEKKLPNSRESLDYLGDPEEYLDKVEQSIRVVG